LCWDLRASPLAVGKLRSPSPREEPPRPAVAVTSTVPPALNQTEIPSQYASLGGEASAAPTGAQELEDVEERQGPFTLEERNFTVVLHYKRLLGTTGPDSQTLASLEIRDATGAVQHQESFPHALEKGGFLETSSADVRLLSGSNGKGLLIDSGCLPSAPLSGGPWRRGRQARALRQAVGDRGRTGRVCSRSDQSHRDPDADPPGYA
jgi:hypothetical protein